MAGWKVSRVGGGGDGPPAEQSISSSCTVSLGRVQPQAPVHRTVFCNDREANALAKFKGSSVSTTKYDVLTFLPKGLFELKFFQNDMAINNSSIEVLQDQNWVCIPWKKLQVGDAKVKQDVSFSADILFLASTNPDGVCYVETAYLDGETNLKIRKALEKTWDYVTPERVSKFKGVLVSEICLHLLYILMESTC